MAKINKYIEIVSTANKRLSSMSEPSRQAACSVLSRYYSDVRITIINDISDLNHLVGRGPDLVFLGMESMLDSNGTRLWLADYLEDNGIACTGSSSKAHKIEHHKPTSKQFMIDNNIDTAPFFVAKDIYDLYDYDINLTYPLFVKPTDRGGGLGIDNKSVVNNFEQLKAKISYITDALQSDSLIEEYLPGREFSVAILEAEFGHNVMPIELFTKPNDGIQILSGKVKHSNSEQAIEVTDQETNCLVSSLAIRAFHALGARDFGRIDIRLDKKGCPQFLEANLIPSLIEGYGSFPKACLMNTGMTYEEMLLKISSLGLSHVFNILEINPEFIEDLEPIVA